MLLPLTWINCVFPLRLYCRVFIGIKKLLGLVDMVRQTEQEYRVVKFLSKLEDEGGLDAGTSCPQ